MSVQSAQLTCAIPVAVSFFGADKQQIEHTKQEKKRCNLSLPKINERVGVESPRNARTETSLQLQR
jgi:hypothetical protein